jgi:hypothetical protein
VSGNLVGVGSIAQGLLLLRTDWGFHHIELRRTLVRGAPDLAKLFG